MTTALEGGVAQSLKTTDAVKQLMAIFKRNTEAAKAKEQATPSQMVSRSEALEQMVEQEKAQADSNTNDNCNCKVEIIELTPTTHKGHGPNIISQDDDDDTSAANTQARKAVHTLVDEAVSNLDAIMTVIEAAGPVHRMSPLQALVAQKLDIAGSAMEITAKKAA